MNDEQLLRYSRHILLPEVDVAGQQRLLAAHVAIIGLGGLGSPVAMYLAASGVGELSLFDFDVVELSNLQRQIIHRTETIGQSKVASAASTLAKLNADVKINTVAEQQSAQQLAEYVKGVDLVLDCTDRFTSRFAINQACLHSKVPWLSASAIALDGQLLAFDPRREDSPCFACLYEDDGEQGRSCADEGVLSPLLGVIGSMQALMALRWLLGDLDAVGEMKRFDARDLSWYNLSLPKKAGCQACSQR